MNHVNRRKFLISTAAVAAINLFRSGKKAMGQDAAASTAEAAAAQVSGHAAAAFPIQTPLLPDGVAGSLKRLQKGARGKTPTEKNFTADWVASLARRGKPTAYTAKNSHNFAYIGMPVGGIGAGQLYLGGDGKLWWWDIFNLRTRGGSEGNYLQPPTQNNAGDGSQVVLAQGFALRVGPAENATVYTLDKKGFEQVEFLGQYPVGQVHYRDRRIPLTVKLEAFSPFLPGNLEQSAYPATILQYTITNTGSTAATCSIAGWLENAVLNHSGGEMVTMRRRNRIVHTPNATMLLADAVAQRAAATNTSRPAITFENFSDGTFKRWTVQGNAFGSAPATYATNEKGRPDWDRQALKPSMLGKYMADSFNTQLGGNPDSPTGKLTSRSFVIDRNFIHVHLAGGNHPGQTCVNLIVGGKVAASATGDNSDHLRWHSWHVATLAGQKAHIEIVDSATGGWGHILVDAITFSDAPGSAGLHPNDAPDFGTLALAVLG
ncbi:MAG: hypothetical protein HKL95_00405, partial [Phycisphaerae bacterium]|nr:hypothetical protein [Phycisphaerae bacterium]